MKKFKIAMALAMLTAGMSLSADEAQATATPAQKPQVAATTAAPKVVEAVASKLSVEEQAFASKLSDQNRKAFAEKLTVDQRKAAMATAKTSTAVNAANDAVAKCLTSGTCAATDKKEVAVAEAVKEVEAATKAK